MQAVGSSLQINVKSPAMSRAYLFCLHDFSGIPFVFRVLADIDTAKPLQTKDFPPKII